MKNKILLSLVFICILMLAGLSSLVICAKIRRYQDFNLVVPYGYGIPLLDLKKVEEISDEEVLVTYEIKRSAAVEAANSDHAVTLFGTNPSYSKVFDLKAVEGSYFQEEAWQTGRRYAVLNEKAAFLLFGDNSVAGNTLMIDSEVFMVTGVVRDGNKKEAVVYVPSTASGGYPQMLMVKTKAGIGVVRNSLTQLGINDSNSKIIDLFAISRAFYQQLTAAILLLFCLILLYTAHKRLTAVRNGYLKLRERYQTMYFDQLIKESRRELVRLAYQFSVMAVCGIISIFLARSILTIVLNYRDIFKQFQYLSDYFFRIKMQWLIRFFYCGSVLSIVYLITLFMAVGIALAANKD